jgi:hypothetical protein
VEGVDVLHEGVLGGQHQAAVRARLGEVRVIVQPIERKKLLQDERSRRLRYNALI